MHDKRRILSVLVAVGTLSVGACVQRPDGVYRVRAQVVEVHGDGAHKRVTMTHESIEQFAGRDGQRGRMPAMTMAFGIGPNIDPASLSPGSQWRITFEVVWDRAPPLRITAVEPLPAGTTLRLANDAKSLKSPGQRRIKGSQ